MNSQEREIIDGIFKRLEQAATQPREPEAERFIADQIRRQPYAPYAMAQLIYVQEEAVKNLNQQVEELRAEVERLQRQPQSGGFLSSIFGGGQRPEPQQRPMGGGFGQPGPQPGMGAGPWGAQPNQMGAQPGMQPGMMGGQPGMMGGGYGAPRQGGGFLGTALATAGGVAGGMMLGSALTNAFRGGHETLGTMGGGDQAGAGNFGDPSQFGGADAGGGFPDTGTGFADAGGGFPDTQNAAFDGGADFGGDAGGDVGGSDDWV